MPALPITYSINGGEPVSGRSLGLSLVSLNLNSMACDEVTLQFTRKRYSVACPLAYDDVVDVYLDERRIFRGRAVPGRLSAAGGPIQILGPWSHFEELTYHVNSLAGYGLPPILGGTFVIYYEEGSEYWNGTEWVPYPPTVTYTWGTAYSWDGGDTGTLNLYYYAQSRLWLFTPDLGGYRTCLEQFNDLVNYVAAVSDPAVIGDVTAELDGVTAPKMRTVEDIRVADGIRQSLASKPDSAIWWDYDVDGEPDLYLRSASLETPVVLTVGEREDGVLGHSVKALDELRPSGVIVRWETPSSILGGIGEVRFVDVYPVGAMPYDARMLVQTVTDNITVAVGLAQSLYEVMSVRRGDGEIRVLDRDWSLGLRPGMVIQIAGNELDEDLQLWVQQVRWDARTGVASVRVGYPQHLTLRERLELRPWLRSVFNPPGTPVQQLNSFGE